MPLDTVKRTGPRLALAALVLVGGIAAAPAYAADAVAPARAAPLPPPAADLATLQREVEATERAFAQTMAARDLAAFATFVAEDAVFIEEPEPLHGRAQVVEGWKVLYANPAAPFSWEPERVEVLASGQLALSTGPVRDPHGKLIGTFTSIWRREPGGAWRIVFDRGNAACDCAGQ